jgi:hypothetical protein
MLGNGPLGDVDDGPPPRPSVLGAQAHPDWAAEAFDQQVLQVRTALETAVRELRHPQTNEGRARLRDGLGELLDGNALLTGRRP